MLELFDGAIDTQRFNDACNQRAKELNMGAVASFIGVIRQEGSVEVLSFDIHEPLLRSWLQGWESALKERQREVLMYHSKGDVPFGTSSFACAILSRNRKGVFADLEAFVEDFKASAPIWKYDLVAGERVYAKERSSALKHSGLLA